MNLVGFNCLRMSLIKFDCSLVLPGAHPKGPSETSELDNHTPKCQLSSSIFPLLASKTKMRDVRVLTISSLIILFQEYFGCNPSSTKYHVVKTLSVLLLILDKINHRNLGNSNFSPS